jgi:hypothetical protein
MINQAITLYILSMLLLGSIKTAPDLPSGDGDGTGAWEALVVSVGVVVERQSEVVGAVVVNSVGVTPELFICGRREPGVAELNDAVVVVVTKAASELSDLGEREVVASNVVGGGESEAVASSDSVVVGMDATSELFVPSGREVVALTDAIVVGGREPEVVVGVDCGGTVRAITDDADDREDFGAVVDPKVIDIGPGKGGLAPGGGPILWGYTMRGGSSKVIDNRD